MDRLIRIARAILFAPLRFLNWVYAPTGRSAPTRGQAIVHLRANGLGMETKRWMEIETDERERHLEALKRVR